LPVGSERALASSLDLAPAFHKYSAVPVIFVTDFKFSFEKHWISDGHNRVTTFGVIMTFEWDEAKNRTNILKHGFDFADAESMFHGPLLIRPDTREDYGEERWIGIGMLARGTIAFVVFSEPIQGLIRIISLRRADHEERKEYEKAIKNGLGTH
jgi:uncharacterized protein